MRRTKIVATLGPSTADSATIAAVLVAGADVVRLNAAHSTPAQLATLLAAVRSAEEGLGRHVGVLVDLPGPKLRVGEVEVGTVLTAGQPFTLCSATCLGDALHACVTYEGLADDLRRRFPGRSVVDITAAGDPRRMPGACTVACLTGRMARVRAAHRPSAND